MGNRVFIFLLVLVFLVFVGVSAYMLGAKSTTTIPPDPFAKPISPTSTTLPSTVIEKPSLSMQYQTPSVATQSATEVVQSFYTYYITCLKQAGNNCNYSASAYIDTRTLLQNLSLKNITGVNQIVCSQNVPQSVSVLQENTTSSKNAASVSLLETFTTGSQIATVSANKEGNMWKITDVSCPD